MYDLKFQVEKCRHVLLLREKLTEQNKTHELSKLDKEASNKSVKAKRDQALVEENKQDTINEKSDEKSVEKWEKVDESEKCKVEGQKGCIYNFTTEGDAEKELAAKCLRLILHGRMPLSPPPIKVS